MWYDKIHNGKQVIFQIQVIYFKSYTRCYTVYIVELLFMCLYVGYSRQFGRKVLVLDLVMNEVPYRTGAATAAVCWLALRAN